ncbi:MAG: hypothetical protein QG657_263 [Acidobacteriota bacterium]|nr:hypothetical protein [Acidobacteriota bacterium]
MSKTTEKVSKKAHGNTITLLLCMTFLSLYPLLTTGCSSRGYHFDSPESYKRAEWNKYLLKREFFTLDFFVIKDESHTPVFIVKGKIISIGDKLSLQDTSGNELAYISQRLFSFTPRYKIFRENEPTATIVKRITLFKPSYTIDVPGQDNYKVVGDFFKYEYTVTRNGEEVAYISKRFFSLPDSYGVSIKPGEDDILILSAVLVIDLVSKE